MAELYPQSLPCRFEGFPPRIRVVCGRAFSERPGTPYSFGSRVILAQTPRSGQTSGVLAVGQPIPTTEIIYADTGDDDRFNLKIAHYGLGRFYLPTADAACWSLAVIKGIRLIEDDEEAIECRTDKVKGLVLKTCFLKKA